MLALPPVCPVLFHSKASSSFYYKLQSCIEDRSILRESVGTRRCPSFTLNESPDLHRGAYLLTATTGSPTQVGENSWGLCFIGFQQIAFSITMEFC